MRAAQIGILVNTALAITKLIAGVVGHAYALTADAIESTADIFSSLIVLGGLHIASQPADENHPYGHGRAEALAAAVVSLMILAAAVGIAAEAVHEILIPGTAPAPWTLIVLVVVMGIKWMLARRVSAVANEVESTAVKADASHHMSDAITSAAAFVGISIAVLGQRLGGGPAWASADAIAALVASAVIFYNGAHMLRPAIDDLMDRVPDADIVRRVSAAARSVREVCDIEKLKIRKVGLQYTVDLHVQADPAMSLHDAHVVSGKVKGAIRAAMPTVDGVLIHMEPYEGHPGPACNHE